ncbi:sensor histidine kinase [Schinkia azotoformans]|uniref:sensor histidine kinase n=1 Tax=Schinkia azotoformans TaxID=1454 RepID=UPI002DB8677B|nr:HAMP domain-containing sensor histidine kinase [Schinkia azotoformans]MEC1743332.1 HAMP domain-containing sensor histidine kinase [Schinkia azotoformans]MEC1769498.1 HAMP domain-containing sensor histidine kinase [Schinkia azotoformans]MEC1788663.1 HAMP domain-containing sensor histidine kinase [Schinkia azotoformans]MED4377334.1 HAMP domain-containing sensor histidine kinase [Schinkia azotoformans]MED4420171.1 HAMP domain-containing sensor histidine kinase [Schinkia azotoformans]
MNKLSIRLGLLFFIFILLIETMLFFFLYQGIVSERIQSETGNLLARGTTHRNVLEKNFQESTIEHVALMETEAATDVVITDENNKVIKSSNEITEGMQELINKSKTLHYTHHGELLEERWKTEKYLVTVSPIVVNDKVEGFVFMFLDTIPIRNMIHQLTNQFLLIGVISIFITLITIFLLSKFIVSPLIEMKKVTEQLSQGNHDNELNTKRDDELGDLARSIQLLSDNLERLKKDRNEFLSSISHDLKTPLTYLKGYADIARRPNLTNEQRDEYLAIIKEEAENVVLLINNLFELAKMDENQFTIHKQLVKMKDFLEKISQKFQPAFNEVNIRLQLKCAPTVRVSIDAERFQQVISNLLDNALKHSPANTTVTVEVNRNKTGTTITIYDEGEGIPEKDLPFIWDRLYRVEKSRSRSTGGSGLGLAIVKKIIEGHGGEISVRSTVNKGTTFTIHLKDVGAN